MISISITRSDVMSIVEGLSVLVSLHNDNVAFERLWASESEQKKLNIYYREAISDLEQRMKEWLPETHAQFSLTASGTDYTLVIKPARWWPTRLSGLLRNKIQDYIVHAIAAGWFATFSGITVQDYAALSAQDLTDVRVLLEQQEFNFSNTQRATETVKPEEDATATAGTRGGDTEKSEEDATATAGTRGGDTEKSEEDATATAGTRGGDTEKPEEDATATAGTRGGDTEKPEEDATATAGTRGGDTEKPEEDATATAGTRGGDTEKPEEDATATAGTRGGDTEKPEEDATATAGTRGGDTEKPEEDATATAGTRGGDTEKPEEDATATAGTRGGDTEKGDDSNSGSSTARSDDSFKTLADTSMRVSMRRKDNDIKDVQSDLGRPFASARNRDNDCVAITHDYTDWSGTDFGRYPDPNGIYLDGVITYPRPPRPAEHKVLPPCPPCPQRHPCPPGDRTAGHHGSDGRYWPREDKPWYGELEEASHQEQGRKNTEYERQMRAKHGPGPYMERYRDLHDQEFMQEHTCGKDDCGSHGLNPLEW